MIVVQEGRAVGMITVVLTRGAPLRDQDRDGIASLIEQRLRAAFA
ncbi:hypothetical protein [Conexibacter sp. CPCC 206217]|nr:hypothetical protein [Conexibacter sp. CPCC 206217]MDO8209728.1 hypothetical protein [Conexibacter sp. CPCC 206217]